MIMIDETNSQYILLVSYMLMFTFMNSICSQKVSSYKTHDFSYSLRATRYGIQPNAGVSGVVACVVNTPNVDVSGVGASPVW